MNLPTNNLRKSLDSMFSKEADCFVGVEKIEGIELFEKRDPNKDRWEGHNCFVYVFGLGKEIPFDLETYSFWMPTKGYSEVEKPEKGDLIIYIDTKIEKEPVHIGFSEGGQKVKSKWTYGNIYTHNINSVPEAYGNLVKFFRGLRINYLSKLSK